MEKRRLKVSQITPGMKLAEAITNSAGITLMPAGIRLTPMFIARIKKWNIDALDVLIETQPEPVTQRDERGDERAGRSGGTKVIAAKAAAAVKPQQPQTQQPGALSAEEQEFARSIALEVSRAFVNAKDNPLMMQLRAVVIKRLILHGQDGIVNALRRHSAVAEGNA